MFDTFLLVVGIAAAAFVVVLLTVQSFLLGND